MSEEHQTVIHPRTTQPVHGSIVRAICTIKKHMDAVAKSQKNAHGNYLFASTDDIYAALSRKMGDVGLISIPLETAHAIKPTQRPMKGRDGSIQKNAAGAVITETVNWLHVEYEFLLATEEGTWRDDAAKRSLFIQYTGPQTHQAAASYVEKAWLRSLFKLPTGDMDLDSLPQGESEETQVALNQKSPRKSSSGAKKDGTDKTFNEIRKDISDAINSEMLQYIRESRADEWNSMPSRWVEILNDEYADKMEEFGAHREAAE